MATIANISVALTARTRKFEKAFKRVSRKITRFGTHVAKVGTIAAAAITVPLTAAVKHFATVGDEAAKMAQRTGVSVRALTQLAHAAKLSGASIGTVEKGIKRMAKAIVDGSQGMTTYVRAFDLIGLQAEDLLGLSPEEAFIKIGGAVGDLTDSIKQQAAAQDLFGKAGTKLIPLFKEGAKGMRAMVEESDALGISFGQVSADKAVALVNAMTALKGAASGLVRMFGETLAPGLTAVARNITDNWGAVRAFMVATFHEIGIEGMRWLTAMQTVADSMAGGFNKSISKIRGYFLDLVGTLVDLLPGQRFLAEWVTTFGEGAKAAAKSYHDEADKMHAGMVSRRQDRETKFFQWEAMTRAGYLKSLEQDFTDTAGTIKDLAKLGLGDEDGAGAGGRVGGLAGAVTRPAAAEAGTVAAYRAGIADPAYRGTQTKLDAIEKNTKKQVETGEQMLQEMRNQSGRTPDIVSIN